MRSGETAPMQKTPLVAYYRVSTDKQGLHGLGMDAQRATVQRFLASTGSKLIGEFAEVESGKCTLREELQKAVALCRKSKARLVIAKLDRLARNAAFLLNLRDSGVDFVCCDMPEANKLTIGIMALIAEDERDRISERTKAGLAEAKKRGTKLGNPRAIQALVAASSAKRRLADAFAGKLQPVIAQIRTTGRVSSLRGIAGCLSARGFKTSHGKAWQAQSVKNILQRLDS
jgi:DNA invertase Pin-like site-specific DNA recombinase